jgi:predicted double-glycine peptidase
LIGEILLTKGKPKKIQGYDDVGYKQINKFVAQNMVVMDPWLQAYEDKKKRLKMPFESNTKVLQGPCLAKMPDFGD